MIIENTELLRLWLTIQLRKLCDADPSALSKYVIALIRKDKPDAELKQGMIDQLDVFLQQQTIPFVERLFVCLNGKEYMEIEDPSDGTVYMLNQGKKLVPYHEIPNPFDTTASSTTSNKDTRDRSMEVIDLNTSSESMQASSVEELEVSTDSDILNTTIESSNSNESEILAADANFKRLTKSVRGSNGSGNSVRKDKLENDRLQRRKSRSPRRNRSRSRDRMRRSWSPKEYPRTGRHRGVMKRSPGRRPDRDVYNRRRNSRNRSTSPYSRSRSPRYTTSSQRSGGSTNSGVYEPKRIRSPIKRERSPGRSPLRSRLDGMETKSGNAVPASAASDQAGRIDNAVAPKLEEYAQNSIGNRCKDFDERGLCMRGELCPYDHGQNPVVLQDVGGVAGMKRTVQIDPEGDHGPIPYRTDPPDFGLVRPNRPMINEEMHNPGPMMWGGMPPFHPGGPRMRGGLMLRPPMFPMPSRELINVPVHGPPPMEEEMPFPPMHHHMGLMFPQQQRHSLRGRGRGGRGGMFDHSRLGGKAKVYTNCSLEVKRIPSSQNTISDLNSHFVQFGKIVNIQINFEDDPEAALITFSSPAEAYSAYKSTEAVLNNRFIRVFWHNKEKENEETEMVPFPPRVSAKSRLGTPDFVDEEMNEAENERVIMSGLNVTKTFYNPQPQKKEFSQEKVQAVEAIKKSQEQLAAHEQQKRVNEEKKRETIKLMHDLQKKKQIMLSEQIEQQKKLINKLENNKGMKPEEREELMKLIKTLQESIETIKKGVDVGSQQPIRGKALVAPFAHQQPQSHGQPPNLKEPVRDILDAELDLYNTELEGGDTVALQKKVAELRHQAYAARGGGGFRGVSAGRGLKIMRGGGVSRTVDRRPTTLLITNFPSSILPELMAHFAQYGLVPYHKPDYIGPSLTMTYENRKCAEAAYLKGRVYKDHILDIKWVVPQKDEFKNGSPDEEVETREDIEV